MPNCFALFRKGVDGPAVKLQTVDDEMRVAFGAEPDAERWFKSWYDIEGLGLAMGFDWAKMRQINPDRCDIIDWLEEHFTPDAWAVVGRR